MTLRYFMMKIRNFVFGIALVCAICFTSCSDGSSSSDSNDTSSRVLDLRIKKNGVVHNSSRSIENAAEITQTAHVKATAVSGGIGDIDYSNLKSRHIDLSYDGTKPTVKVLNVIPPEGDNVETRIGYYAQNSSTESDWNNDTIWFGNYIGDKSETISSTKLHNAKDYTNPNSPVYYEEDSKILKSEDGGKNWKIDEEATKECQELLKTGFSHFFESTNKSYLFAQYAYTFEVNEMEYPERYVWRTAILDSDIIKVK